MPRAQRRKTRPKKNRRMRDIRSPLDRQQQLPPPEWTPLPMWECGQCTAVNDDGTLVCICCGTPFTGPAGKSS